MLVLHSICNRKTVLLECKTEMLNSQFEQGQPIEQTRGLFCTCESGVVNHNTSVTSGE